MPRAGRPHDGRHGHRRPGTVSAGVRWGDGGFAYASDAYAASAFDEACGAVL